MMRLSSSRDNKNTTSTAATTTEKQQQQEWDPSQQQPQHQQQRKQQQQLILAIDIGSSSTRCVVFGWDAQQHKIVSSSSHSSCNSRQSIRAISSTSGHFDPQLLLNAIDHVVDETLQKLRQQHRTSTSSFEIVAMGFTSFVMNLVGVDDKGQPVGEAATLSYACCSPAVLQQVLELKRELGPEHCERIYRATGAPIHASYALAQLRVLYNNNKNKNITDRIAKWTTLSSCCINNWMMMGTSASSPSSLFKSLPISYSEASWTGLLNYETCAYEPTVLKLLPQDCVKALPDLADYNDLDCLVGIPQCSSYYQKWPELCKARFLLGLGDGACANIGSKCTDPTRIACTVGTSAAARICLPLPIRRIEHSNNNLTKDSNKESNSKETAAETTETASISIKTATTTSSSSTSTSTAPCFVKGLFCYRIDKSHVLVGGALTDGGSVVDWVRQLLNLESSEEAWEKCVSDVQELADQDWNRYSSSSSIATNNNSNTDKVLTFVPFLSGERNPGFRESATGAVLGLTRATRPAHLVKACLEGVTLRLNAILEPLLELQRLMMVSFSPSSTSNPSSSSNNDDDNNNNNTSNVRTRSTTILVSGKALEVNALWRQMLSDCTGTAVILDQDAAEDSTSRGVACMAAAALGLKSLTTSSKTNNHHDNDHHSLLLPLEAIHPSSKVSEPRLAMNSYWKWSALEQEQFLQAVTPLYYGYGDDSSR